MSKEGGVRWLSELNKASTLLVGGKAANLAEMYKLGLPVPQAFVVTAEAYKNFLILNSIDKEIYNLLKQIAIENTHELDKTASQIQQIILDAKFSKEIEAEIAEAYELLDVNKAIFSDAAADALGILKTAAEPVFVAVRSSATAEDSAEASFAGQQETFINVKGKYKVLDAIKKCFASLFSSRSIYYRVKNGFQHEQVNIAVVVQKMVNSDKSGVIFTQDPVAQTDNIIIEAVFGLGEGIVSGKIKPDHIAVMRNFEVLEKIISEKKIALVRDSGGYTEAIRLTEDKSNSPVLSDYEIRKLTEYALKLEVHYEKPQDIEFAIDSGNIFIVQTRPITTLNKRQEKRESKGKEILLGQAASPGIASGIVKIVHKIAELQKIRKGDILVTEMTSPDMVVTMQKAAAIVTDEGGATCFSGDTKVLTNRGFMAIKDATELVNSGEEIILFAYDSKMMRSVWKRIISAAARKRQAIRIVVSQTGKIEDNYIDLTPDHKMITFEGRNLIKEQIDSMLSRERQVCLVDTLPFSERINNPKLAYLMGALLSDGSITLYNYKPTGNLRRGKITFTQKEIPQKKLFIDTVRGYFEECFGDKFKEGRLKYTHNNFRGRVIQGFASDYVCHNLDIAKVITKISQSLDKFVLGLDQQSCLNFLAGLIDGDGCLYKNRLHVYADKENVLQGVILACLNLGIFPQITRNRTINHIQILERLDDILRYTKRVNGEIGEKLNGNKLFSAKQVFGNIVEDVNFKGRIKPYVEGNLLIDSRKIIRDIIPIAKKEVKEQLTRIMSSSLRMQRAKKLSEIGEIEVYNLEIDADNELDHNFVVFTKKYTPLLVSNSHAAIVSREMGIPCVVGTRNATTTLKEGEHITVNGFTGRIYEGEAESLEANINPVVETKTEIKVIVDIPDAAKRASQTQVKSVGLARIEGIVAAHGRHPFSFKGKETKVYEDIIYSGLSKIAKHFDSVWVRTSDIRSDEFQHLSGAPELNEGNPMLGFHGIRASLKNSEILEAELLAASRVAEKGKEVGIILPQIISVDEVKQVKIILKKIGVENLILGVMVETPSAVQIIEQLCEEGIKFISFGTNDLTQYTLAVDRNNENVQYLYDEMHPAVLNQISYVIGVCKKYGVKTSICGQAGSNKEMAKFLVRHGIDSISVNADAAAEISVIVKELEETLKIEDSTEEVLQESVENIPEENAEIGESVENKRLEEFVASDDEVIKNAVGDAESIDKAEEALPVTEGIAGDSNSISEEADIPEIVEEKNVVEEIPFESIPPELFESSDRELKEELEREKSIPTERLLDIY